MTDTNVRLATSLLLLIRRSYLFYRPWTVVDIDIYLTFNTFMVMLRYIWPGWFALITGVVLQAQFACKSEDRPVEIKADPPMEIIVSTHIDYDTSKWTELKAEDGYVIDIKYASTDNFVQAVIYPCGRMFLRPAVASALANVRDMLKPQGYQLKLFDGYRPRSAQQKLWDKVPDRNYVAPPSEGSMHNRGAAIDLTLANAKGEEIDMGTPYDFFGPEAHHSNTNLPDEILAHRQLLKKVMESNGFQSIRTEWWHYSYAQRSYALDDWQWPCSN